MYLSIIKATYDKTMVDIIYKSFPGGSDGKAPDCNAGDPCSIPGLGRFSGEGYRFFKRQIKWSGIPISFRIFHSLL